MWKKLICFALLAAMIGCGTGTFAEEVEAMTFFDAMNTINAVGYTLLEMNETEQNEDAKLVYQNCSQRMAEMLAGLMLTNGEEQPKESDVLASTITNGFYETGTVFLSEYNVSKDYSIKIDNNVYLLLENTFDSDMKQENRVQIELASRPETDEYLLLYSVYEEASYLSSTIRALVYKCGEESKNLYTRTFGLVTDLQIDLKKWSEGEEYAWDVSLLFPPVA